MESTMDVKIENALRDEVICKTMNKASRSFRKQLDRDIIKTCQLNALWKTFVNHDITKGAKFTTYLYQGVFIECMRELKFKQRGARYSGQLHDNIPTNELSVPMLDIMDELSEKDRELLQDRMSNMTIAEIAQKHGINRESTRRKVHQIINNLQKKFA